jgi:hypothetical protein
MDPDAALADLFHEKAYPNRSLRTPLAGSAAGSPARTTAPT